MNCDKIIVDFKNPAAVENIMIINDGVMGGVSDGRINYNKNQYARFFGSVSSENNGGFTSFRMKIENQIPSDCNGIMIRAKGDGKIYKITLRTDGNFDGVSYQAEFKTESGKLKDYSIQFNEFSPRFRGRIVDGQPKLLSQNIKQVGLLITDKQFGEFEIELDHLKFY